MMKKMMKKIALVFAAATITITAGAALASAKEPVKLSEEEQMAQDDAISEIFDRALDSGLFTQAEIDEKVSTITDLMEQYKNSKTEEEQMSFSDQIAAILDEMEDVMAQNL